MMRLIKEMFIIGIGVLAIIYLINPGAGIIEFLPDNIPFIGNIDEGFATMILISVARHYGFDVGRLFGDGNKGQVMQQPRIVDKT